MLTHKALERDAKKAIAIIDELDMVTDKTVMIRVEGSKL